MSLTPRERERLDALVAAYRQLPQVEPPAAIDAAVRAHARAALRRGSLRMPGLLATAATMTIAIGLAWQLRDAEDLREAQRPAATSVPAPQGAEPLERAEILEDGPVASSDAALREQRAKSAESRGSRRPLDELSKSAAPDAPPPVNELKSEADAEAPADARARAPMASPQPIPQVEQASQASGEPPSRERRQAPLESNAAPPPPPAAPPAPSSAAASPPADVSEATTASVAAPAVAPAVAKRAAANERDEPSQERIARDEADGLDEGESAPGARADAVLRAASASRAPHDWLHEISRLLRIGQRERAIESLREFRDAHPDVELPPELAELLP